jgi:peptidoglycan/LPS O-acetylase OafA/YrhL
MSDRVQSTDGNRLPLVESLRGLAALAVLLFHSLSAFDSPGGLTAELGFVRRFTAYGYLGVSVFFALSGWCITQRLSTAFRRGESVPVFLAERGLRIFPVYWAALAAAVLLRLAALPFRHASLAAALPASARAWVGDLLLVQPYVGTDAYVMVSWSLVFELGFYVLAAGALAGRRLGARPGWLLAGGAGACFWFLVGQPPRALFVLGRWPDFFAGVLAWWIVHQNAGAARVAGLVFLLSLSALTPIALPDLHRLTAVTTALLLVGAAWWRPPDTGLLRLLGRAGTISYSLYLIHVAVLSPFTNLAQRFVAPTTGWFGAVWLAALAAAGAAGWALHHWVEAPVERWRRPLFSTRKAGLANPAAA